MFSKIKKDTDLRKNTLLMGDIVVKHFQKTIDDNDDMLSALFMVSAVDTAKNILEFFIFGGNKYNDAEEWIGIVPEKTLKELTIDRVLNLEKITILLLLAMFLQDPANIFFKDIERIVSTEEDFTENVFKSLNLNKKDKEIFKKISEEFNGSFDQNENWDRFTTYLLEFQKQGLGTIIKKGDNTLKGLNKNKVQAEINLLRVVIYPSFYSYFAKKTTELLSEYNGYL